MSQQYRRPPLLYWIIIPSFPLLIVKGPDAGVCQQMAKEVVHPGPVLTQLWKDAHVEGWQDVTQL
jgi:hypothetical protein